MKTTYKTVLMAVASVALVVALAGSARASNAASDNAGNYNPSTWGAGNTNPNLGFGFGGWVFDNTNNTADAGTYIGTSGSGVSTTNIDTLGQSFGAYQTNSNPGGELDIIRPFTGGALSVGQSVSVSFQNRAIATGGVVGFSLLDNSNLATANKALEYYFVGGGTNYDINNGTETIVGGDGFTFDGQILTFTLASASTMNLTVQNVKTGSIITDNGIALNPSAGGIDAIRFFDANDRTGSANDAFFNSLTVSAVPEPSTIALVGAGLLGMLALRRRKA